MLPERLTGDPVTITDGAHAPYATTNYTLNTAYTAIELTYPLASDESEFSTSSAVGSRPPSP